MEEHFLIAMTNISKSFGGVTALNDVTFKVLPGEIHALVEFGHDVGNVSRVELDEQIRDVAIRTSPQ